MDLKNEKTRSCSRNQPGSIFKQGVDRTDPLVSLDTNVRRRADLFVTNLKPKDPHIYKITPSRLLLSIFVFCHCLGKHTVLPYSNTFLHSKLFRVFRLERRSKTIQRFVLNSLFSTLFIFALYSYYCYDFLCYV